MNQVSGRSASAEQVHGLSERRLGIPELTIALCLLILLTGTLAMVSSPVSAALPEEVQIHDIDPPGTYQQNITGDERAQFVLVVKHAGTNGNVTILLSNESSGSGWYVESSIDMFTLAPNGSMVVRIVIWPGSYGEGSQTEVTLRILAIRDSESDEIIRTYTVLKPTSSDGGGKSGDDDTEVIRIMGLEMDVPEFLDHKIGRFAILTFFWVVLTIVVLVLIDPFVKAFTKKTETQLDDIILSIIRKPLFVLIIIYGLIESLDTLDPPSEIIDALQKIYGIVFVATAVYTAYRIFTEALSYMDKLASKTTMGNKVHHALVPALSKVGSIIFFFFIGLNVILGYLGMDLALLLGGMTIMGLVIAFAAQDTLSNFFGGIFLILEPNFKEDDTIILQGTTYNVKEIGMRTTQLYDISNHALVIIPNNILANEKILTLTEPDRHIKMNIEVGVAYGTDVDLVEDTLMILAKSHPEIITESEEMPFVRFQAFGASSLDFKLVFWVNDLSNRFRVRHEIMKRVYKKFEELGIEIPFPQRVVTMVDQGSGENGPDESDGPVKDEFGENVIGEARNSPATDPKEEPKSVDPIAANAEVKGDTGKPHDQVIRERSEEQEKLKQMGNVDSNGLEDASDEGGGGNGDGDDE